MSTDQQEYCGFRNYPTWCVFVWVNTCASQYWRDRFEHVLGTEIASQSLPSDAETLGNLATELERWVCEENPLLDHASLYGDLLRGTMNEVDWMGIANSLLADAGIHQTA